jgi:acetoin utilization protein AcuB
VAAAKEIPAAARDTRGETRRPRGMARAALISMRHHHQEPRDLARMLMTVVPATATADDNLMDAAARMAERNVRHLPVVDGDHHVVGMLSDRDVRTVIGNASRPLRPDDAQVRLRSLRVTDAMTRDAFVVNHNASFDDLVRVFMDQRVGAVPVVDDGERLVGIISYVDVFKNAGAL